MRECIYCGRALEKDEKCTCAMSVAKRMEKEGKTEFKAEKPPKKEKKKREKKTRTYTRPNFNFNGKNAFLDAWHLFVSFIKSPIDTVMNPGEMNWASIFILIIFEGIIGGLCIFSAITGAVRGPLSLLGNAMGFRGIAGYEMLKGWLLAALSGGVSGIAVFFLYSGIFYAVNRWIVKQFSPYREFIKRFVFVALPIAVLGALGVVLGLFSQTTFILLLACGLVGSIIITYEILRSVWYQKSPTYILYTMMACIFVFLVVFWNFIKIA